MGNTRFIASITSGPKEETPEMLDRRVINGMVHICYINNIEEINFHMFREEIKQYINEEASVHDILVYFDNMSLENKIELIKKCGKESNNKDILKSLSDRLHEKSKELRDSIQPAILTEDVLLNTKKKKYSIPLNPMSEKEYTRRDNFNKFINSKMQNKRRVGNRYGN